MDENINNIPIEERQRASEVHKMLKYDEALRHVPFWQSCGAALFSGDMVMQEKWNSHVVNSVNDGHNMGLGIPEALQVMTMLNAGASTDLLKEVMKSSGDPEIIEAHLYHFLHPEIVESIRPDVSYK